MTYMMKSRKFLSHAPLKIGAAALVLGLSGLALPMQASARNYDGYCYQKESAPRTKGTVIGALAGAAVGNVVAGDGHKSDGTIVGAVVGAAIGNAIGNEQKKQDRETGSANCYQSRYYVYEDEEYDPPPPPRGYRVAYFYERPSYGTYYVIRDGREERWRDRRDRRDRDRYGD